MSANPTDTERFEQMWQAISRDEVDAWQPRKASKAVSITSWVLKLILAPWQAWQWGRLVFAVMQLLAERSPLIPEAILDSTPPVAVGLAGYGMNALVPLVLADLAACFAVFQQLQAEFVQAKELRAYAKATLKLLFSLFFIACGVLYYWPVVGSPTPLSNQSFPEWKSGYDVTDNNSALNAWNQLTYAVSNTLIMGPSGFYLANGLVEAASHGCDKSKQKEVRRIQGQLARIMQKPDLRFWYAYARSNNPSLAELPQLVAGVQPEKLALAALYADNRQSGCARLGEQQANLLVTFILNYGFIPFTLLVFDTLKAVNGVVSAIFSLAATATNFMLTLTLNSEIFGFLNSLSPCRPQPIGLALTTASLFLVSAFILYFSSMIYLPDAFEESIADCAFTDGIDNITFDSNVTIPCPANSAAWFGVQLVLAVANPFLYNLSLLMSLSAGLYKAVATCLAKQHKSYQAAAAWIQFRNHSVKKLESALGDEEFLARFTRMMLREGNEQTDLRELYCARVYEGVPVIAKSDDPVSARSVLQEVAGSKDITLPDGLMHIKPFKLGCWQWVYWLKELPVMAVSIYYWNAYDSENSVNPTPHLPKLGDGVTALIVLAGVWLSSVIPLVIDAIRLGKDKQLELMVYQENSKPLCGSNRRAFGLVRPILSRLRYFGLQAMAAVLTVPLLVGVYHLAVTMLEAAIELNLHALAPEVESITAMAFQGFVLAGLAGMIRQFQDSLLQLGLTARCNRRVSPGDQQFASLSANVLGFGDRPVTFATSAQERFLPGT